MLNPIWKSNTEALIKVIVSFEPRDNWYAGHVPSMPGCCSQGRNEKELKLNILEAMEAYIYIKYNSFSHCQAFSYAHRDNKLKDVGFFEEIES